MGHTSLMEIFNYIKADQFFPSYLPHIKNYKHKIRCKNGRGNPLEFSATEKRQINTAVKKMAADCRL